MSQLPTASPFTIAGGLNYPSAGGDVFQNYNSPAGLGNSYAQSYNQALAANSQQYQNIIGGYQGLMTNQQNVQQGIQGGYGALQGQVANTLGFGGSPWGIAAPAAQAIGNLFDQSSGQTMNDTISRGIGNSTVAAGLQRGNEFSAASAYAGLGANLAQTYAGYQSNLGLAGLQYGNEANMQNTALGNQQLGFMGSINMPYPNAGAYNSLLQQYGYNQQVAQNQQMQQSQFQQLMARANMAGAQPMGTPVTRAPMQNVTQPFASDYSTGYVAGGMSPGVGGGGAPMIGGGQMSQYYGGGAGQQGSDPYGAMALGQQVGGAAQDIGSSFMSGLGY